MEWTPNPASVVLCYECCYKLDNCVNYTFFSIREAEMLNRWEESIRQGNWRKQVIWNEWTHIFFNLKNGTFLWCWLTMMKSCSELYGSFLLSTQNNLSRPENSLLLRVVLLVMLYSISSWKIDISYYFCHLNTHPVWVDQENLCR